MIQNKKGIINLKILDKIKNNFIKSVHYGHFDYCLSEKLFSRTVSQRVLDNL